ncbi:MAG TPA: LysM peptidoglycan-binding domain-containing M23 family metallopeptidase [Azospirillum sp.]|nr:LysM peptidoglycan-binding domain-containing M23 family metallopeptidase [Azospirillum sp.]
MTASLRPLALLALAVLVPLASACQRSGPLPPVTTVHNAPESAGGAIIVARGDNLYMLSRRYNVPLRDLIDANRLAPPYTLEPGQRLVLPASRQYIVQKGDTLTSISRMYNVEMTELSRLNGLSAPYAVHIGQPLRLPAGGNRISETADAGASSAPVGVAPPPGTAVPAAKVSRGSIQVTELPPPGGAPAPTPSSPSSKPMGVPLPAPSVAPAAPPVAAAAGAPDFQPGEGPKLLRPPSAKPAEPAPTPVAEPAPAQQEVAVAPPPKAEVGAPPPRGAARFMWPLKGKLVSGFGPKPDGMNNDGINIAAPKGTAVMAADNGVVAYAGNELRGFGNLLLVKHDGGWITAYAHLDKMEVDRGARVKRGQRIGTVGQTGSVTSPQLHFELRKGSHVVDPREQMEANPQFSEGASPGGLQGPG